MSVARSKHSAVAAFASSTMASCLLCLRGWPRRRAGAAPAIGGQVRYYSNQAPVPDVSVQLLGAGAQTSATTDADGAYGFADPGAGDWQIDPIKLGDARGGDQCPRCQPGAAGGGRPARVHAAAASRLRRDRRRLDQLARRGAHPAVVAGLRTRFPVAETCGSDWAFVPDPAAAPNQHLIEPQMAPSCTVGGDRLRAAAHAGRRPDLPRHPVRRLYRQLAAGGAAADRDADALVPATPTAVADRTTATPIATATPTVTATPTRHRDGDRDAYAVPDGSPRRRPPNATHTATGTPTRTQTLTRTGTATGTATPTATLTRRRRPTRTRPPPRPPRRPSPQTPTPTWTRRRELHADGDRHPDADADRTGTDGTPTRTGTRTQTPTLTATAEPDADGDLRQRPRLERLAAAADQRADGRQHLAGQAPCRPTPAGASSGCARIPARRQCAPVLRARRLQRPDHRRPAAGDLGSRRSPSAATTTWRRGTPVTTALLLADRRRSTTATWRSTVTLSGRKVVGPPLFVDPHLRRRADGDFDAFPGGFLGVIDGDCAGHSCSYAFKLDTNGNALTSPINLVDFDFTHQFYPSDRLRRRRLRDHHRQGHPDRRRRRHDQVPAAGGRLGSNAKVVPAKEYLWDEFPDIAWNGDHFAALWTENSGRSWTCRGRSTSPASAAPRRQLDADRRPRHRHGAAEDRPPLDDADARRRRRLGGAVHQSRGRQLPGCRLRAARRRRADAHTRSSRSR